MLHTLLPSGNGTRTTDDPTPKVKTSVEMNEGTRPRGRSEPLQKSGDPEEGPVCLREDDGVTGGHWERRRSTDETHTGVWDWVREVGKARSFPPTSLGYRVMRKCR